MRTRMNEGEWGDPEGQWGEYVEEMHIRMKKPRSGDPNSQLSEAQNTTNNYKYVNMGRNGQGETKHAEDRE